MKIDHLNRDGNDGKGRKPTYIGLPRTKNLFADALATLASMISIPEGIEIRPIEIEVREDPADCLAIEEGETRW